MLTRPSANRNDQEIGLADFQLKIWKQQTLQRNDWDFAGLEKFPPDMIRVAWLYELDRELGSGNPPYLVAWRLYETKKSITKLQAHNDGTHPLSQSELAELLPKRPKKNLAELEADLKKMRAHFRAKQGKRGGKLLSDEEWSAMHPLWKPSIPKEPEPMLRSFDHHEFSEMKVPAMPGYRWVNGQVSSHCTIHPLEIDWTLTESELVEAFRNWLRKGEHYPFSPSYKRGSWHSKIGKRKKAGWLARLRDLAIYRISEAGLTRRQGLIMLGNITMSAANWEHAQARTRKRIKEERQRCEFNAWDQGQGSPEDWREYFVKPFGGFGL